MIRDVQDETQVISHVVKEMQKSLFGSKGKVLVRSNKGPWRFGHTLDLGVD